MTLRVLFYFLSIFCISFFACKKDDSSVNTSNYVNKIELGTGTSPSDPMILVGISNSFTTSQRLYFRLECIDEIQNSPIIIEIEKITGGIPSNYATIEYPANPNSAHVYLSSFNPISVKGNYKIYGKIKALGKAVASLEFSIN